MRRLLVLAAIALATVVALSILDAMSNYYVDSANGDDSNPGSWSAPWKTIQKAVDTMPAGTTVKVRGGMYDERVRITRSGSRETPMTLQAQGSVVTKGFMMTGSFVRVIGFEIANTTASGPDCGQAAVYSSGSFNEVRDNDIHDVAAYGVCLDSSSSNSIVSANRVSGAGGVGIWAHGSGHLVEKNDISRTVQYQPRWTGVPDWIDADGVYIDGTGLTFRKNTIHDIRVTDAQNRGDPHIDCFQVGENALAIDIIIEENTCSIPQLDVPRCFQAAMIEGKGGVRNLAIANNVVHDMCRGFTIHGTTGPQTGVRVVNNTFYNLQEYGLDACNAPAIEVKNNIFHTINHSYFTNAPGCRDSSGAQDSSSDIGNNLAYRTVGRGHSDDLWDVDPRFVDPSNGNFRLQSDSPAIDAGTMVSLVTRDFEGTVRPQGPAYDIGAFEFSKSHFRRLDLW